MRRLALLAALLAACSDDGADAPDPSTDCDGCRTIGAGQAFQDGDTAIGVEACDGASCSITVLAADGSESDLHVAAGDAIDAGSGWTVVATGAAGLTLRPS